MDLDRGVLARLDRKLLAGLGQDETYRMVRVPVTAARWSTWRRYCESAGVSMGRAIVTLIDRELASVFGESDNGDMPVFAAKAERELGAREAAVVSRERGLDATEERSRGWGERLRHWEAELRSREQQVDFVAKMAPRRRETGPKVGRNERCPCDSGLKYKRCHGP